MESVEAINQPCSIDGQYGLSCNGKYYVFLKKAAMVKSVELVLVRTGTPVPVL